MTQPESMSSGPMAAEGAALLLPALRHAAEQGGPPDAGLLDGWMALWALASAGRAGDDVGLAVALAGRPTDGDDLLSGPMPDAPPVPAVATATVLALEALGQDRAGDPALRGLQARAAQAVNAAWRPNGRFAFTRQSVPVAPGPLEIALAVAAWARLPDPVAERRYARAAGVMGAVARLPGEAGPETAELAAAAALWAAAELARHAGLTEARPALMAAAESRLRGDPPADPTARAMLALALAAAAAVLARTDPQPADHMRRGATRLLRPSGEGGRPVRAAALAVVAAATLPASTLDGPAMPRRPALRPVASKG
ncbi:hypothetical protein ACFOGJ_21310 [Marinibaculum pumilum]|uniref:Uncharacterized protein n=1 Tax=Marinibaculum pumilum TaxID=1766165 RepID=A0ABV7L6A7_9PROT